MNNKQTNKCTECKGSKKMYVNQFYEEENTIPCIYCKGTGTTETKFSDFIRNSTEEEATGVFTDIMKGVAEDQKVILTRTMKSIMKNDDCESCKGTGKQEEFELDGKNYNKYGKETKDGDYRKVTPVKQEQTMEERFIEQFKKQFIDGGIAVLLDYPPHERVLDESRTINFIKEEIDLAVQQERERILQKAKDILDKEAEYYGTDKHGLSYEQLEYIIEAINQYHE